jgi:hypothetical protein
MMNADVVIIVHSCPTTFRLFNGMDKKMIVWHTGTRFRQAPNRYNEMFASASKVFYDLAEFESLVPESAEYFSMTVDTDALPYSITNNKKYVVSHHPSNAEVKGTETIRRLVSEIDNSNFELNINTSIATYQQNIARVRQCDIYLEQFALSQGGKPHGSWGTTALECSSMGKVVITNMLWADCYKKYYGSHGLVIANTENEFKNRLVELVNMDEIELENLKLKARIWVVQKHGYKATAERLIKHL